MAHTAFDMRGGLDLSATYLKAPAGTLLRCKNVESEPKGGGYGPIKGFERFDGQLAPSDASYSTMNLDDQTGITPPTNLTGTTSGATARILSITEGLLVVTDIVGTFLLSEPTNFTGNVSQLPVLRGLLDDADELVAIAAAREYYRGLITEVPGINAVRGAWLLDDVVYAFRDFDGSSLKIYKSSSTGWINVPTETLLQFDTQVDDIFEGDTVDNGLGASATVERVGILDATLNTGWLVLSGVTGAWADTDPIRVSAVTKANADGISAPIVIAPAGKYEFITYNFTGDINKLRAYGADGVNRGFEFDGAIYAPILTISNAAQDKPKYVESHKSHLWFALPDGRIRHSVIGDPFNFSGSLGAVEYGIGGEITGIKSQPETLIVATEKYSEGVYGDNVANWTRSPINRQFGAKNYTLDSLFVGISLDDYGVMLFDRSQVHGKYLSDSASDAIKNEIVNLKDLATASLVMLSRSQYRLYFNNNRMVICTFTSTGIEAITFADYGKIVNNAYQTYSNSGVERFFFVSDDGYVYESEKGTSLDGANIDWFFKTSYAHSGTPQMRKKYRRVKFEVEAEVRGSFSFQPSFSRSEIEIPDHDTLNGSITSGSGYWDEDLWDEVFWDGQIFSQFRNRINGIGTDISFTITGSSSTDEKFFIRDALIEYKPGREERY